MALLNTGSSTICLLVTFFLCNAEELPYEDMHKTNIQYTLPDLGFGITELEPFIDAGTIRAHHGGHHRIYTEKLNLALAEWREELPKDALAKGSIVDILKNIDLVPAKYKTRIRNQGGGYLNHCFYWAMLSGNAQREDRRPPSLLAADIDATFGSFENFRDAFTEKAKGVFGSGYAWLSRDKENALVLSTSANQDCPLSEGLRPILVIDVWEHAYYLRHQMRRAAYIADWWKVVDWQKVDMLDMWWADLEAAGDSLKDEL